MTHDVHYVRLANNESDRDVEGVRTDTAPPPKKKTRLTRRTSRYARPLVFVVAIIVILVVLLVVLIKFTSQDKPTSQNNKPVSQQDKSVSQDNNKPTVSPSPPPRLEFKASTFNWTTVPLHHPFPSPRPLPSRSGTPRRAALPKIQHNSFAANANSPETQRRREAVRKAFLKCWNNYKARAWLRDELTPVSGGARDTFGGWAATLVDSLDTLWIMDLKPEFYTAAAAAATLDFANTSATGLNTFETTIRHLGGLLSAYDLSGENALLLKATELGEMIYHAFDTPNHMPPYWFDFASAKNGSLVADTGVGSAAPTSLSLEFTRLAQLTGKPKYYEAISLVTDFLQRTQKSSGLPGMWPKFINTAEEKVNEDNSFSLGGQADSLYEYLIKMFLLLGGRETRYAEMYRDSMDVVRKHLLFRAMIPEVNISRGILFPGDAVVNKDRGGAIELVAEGQHLSCFVGGMLGIGGQVLGVSDHVDVGGQIARGCAWAYDNTPTGIMPEVFGLIPCAPAGSEGSPCQWDENRWEREGKDKRLGKGFAEIKDSRYILRPEAVESLFIMYRITGDETWRDHAWKMFERIMAATETKFGNSAIADVAVTGKTEKKDEMEVGFPFLFLSSYERFKLKS